MSLTVIKRHVVFYFPKLRMKAVLNKMHLLIAAILIISVSCEHYDEGYFTSDTRDYYRSHNNAENKYHTPHTYFFDRSPQEKIPLGRQCSGFLKTPAIEYIRSEMLSRGKHNTRLSFPWTYSFAKSTKRLHNYYVKAQKDPTYSIVHRREEPHYRHAEDEKPNYKTVTEAQTYRTFHELEESHYRYPEDEKPNYKTVTEAQTYRTFHELEESHYRYPEDEKPNYKTVTEAQTYRTFHELEESHYRYPEDGRPNYNTVSEAQRGIETGEYYKLFEGNVPNYDPKEHTVPIYVPKEQNVATEPHDHRQAGENTVPGVPDQLRALTPPETSYTSDGIDIITNDDDDDYKRTPKSQVKPQRKSMRKNEEEYEGIRSSNVQNLLLELLKQSAAKNYVPKKPADFFDFLRDSYPLPTGFKSPLAEYDYVIVGAGSAGSVLASRLTERASPSRITVLLIEAGKPEMLLTDVPALAPAFQATDYAFQYYMEYQPRVCMGMINRRCFWPRGRAVGGTSVINYMIYTRGRPQEWDRIAADGNWGWSYKDVLKYYIKSEKSNLKDYSKRPYRGRDGKQSVEFVPFRTKLVKSFLEAGRLLGHPTVDYNDPDSFGFGYVQSTMINGRRQSSARAYLHRHKRRNNLHILPETYATKVLINKITKRAYGVEYVRNHLKYRVMVRKEVILSAGPIASPQLLMLSGVGPEDHLRSLNINLIQNLNVGRTLYDHITFPGIVFKLNTTNVSLQEGKLTEPLNFKSIAAEWSQYGEGPLTSPGGVEGIGYIKTNVSDDPDLVPDIELIDIGGSIASDSGGGGSQAVRRGMRIRDDVYNSAFGPVFATDTWTAFPMLLHPKSKGYMELRDSNPFSSPKLYGNYLTDPRDVATFIAAIRHVIKLAETEPFQKFGATLHKADLPTCRQHEFNTDGYWECAVRTLTATLHHQIATCKMGPATDPDAVVDSELRVHGIEGLRVVDSSIIPRTTSAHTNAPAMMIGEMAADLIKRTWKDEQY